MILTVSVTEYKTPIPSLSRKDTRLSRRFPILGFPYSEEIIIYQEFIPVYIFTVWVIQNMDRALLLTGMDRNSCQVPYLIKEFICDVPMNFNLHRLLDVVFTEHFGKGWVPFPEVFYCFLAVYVVLTSPLV